MLYSSGDYPLIFGGKSALRILAGLESSVASLKKQPVIIPDGHPTHKELLRAQAYLEKLGIFTEGPEVIELLAGNCRGRFAKEYRLYQCSKTIHGAHLIPLGQNVFTLTASAAFIQLARSYSLFDLLQVGYEICGTYRSSLAQVSSGSSEPEVVPVPSSNYTAFDQAPLCSMKELRAFLQMNPKFDGARKAACALAYLAEGSASPRETQLAIILSLPMNRGGYGLRVPKMNKEVLATKEAYRIAGRKSFRCDLCWESAKLDVEYQSREFHQGERSRISDSRRANALRAMGYSVIAITNDELESISTMDVIAKNIAQACGKRFRVTLSDYRKRQVKLRRSLGLPVEH